MPPFSELVRASNQDRSIVISGRRIKPIGGVSAEGSTLSPQAVTVPIGDATLVEPNQGCLLFDDVDYRIQIIAPERCPVTLGHQPLETTWMDLKPRWLGTATISFHQLGWTELRAGDFGMRMKVVSRKIDFETDYRAMVRDLERQIRGLSARLLSTVATPMKEEESKIVVDLPSYWIAVLDATWQELARDIQRAWHSLPPELRPHEEVAAVDRLRKVGKRESRTFAQVGRSKVVVSIRRWDFLTPERQYLLHVLLYIHRHLERVYAKEPKARSHLRLSAIFGECTSLLLQLSRAAGVERVSGDPRIPNSPLAQSHSALRRVIRGHRRLTMGLFPDGERYLVGLKNVSLLYEYWCYLTIIRMVVDESHGQLRMAPSASADPMDLVLNGENRAAHVDLPGGRTIDILYQRRFQGLPTVAQQPDHVVAIQDMDTLVIFDAKYRFEQRDEVLSYYGQDSPIPPIDTINGMHQYHDAIVTPHIPYHRLVDRAIVLFPLPAPSVAAWRTHRFYQSLESVGVGALPALPGCEDVYLREEIRRYLTRLVATPPKNG